MLGHPNPRGHGPGMAQSYSRLEVTKAIGVAETVLSLGSTHWRLSDLVPWESTGESVA